MHLKPLNQQVMVITGASSGIGLATARAAAEKGASVVLAARSERTLGELAGVLSAAGREAIACACDVTDREQVEKVAQATIYRFGRIDTWVNNAGVGMYGRLEECSEQDSRRLFDVNFWGVVNGSLAALPHLKANGGALINVGSEASEDVVPLLGMYAASKHAVKGFTDALRVEIEHVEGAPVSITLIEPAAVNTPFPHHARNYMTREPKLPPPLIDPKDVAEAVLDAATTHIHNRKVGAMAKVNTLMAKFAPSVAEMMAAKQRDRQQTTEGPRNPGGVLFEASERSHTAGRVHGVLEEQPA